MLFLNIKEEKKYDWKNEGILMNEKSGWKKIKESPKAILIRVTLETIPLLYSD